MFTRLATLMTSAALLAAAVAAPSGTATAASTNDQVSRLVAAMTLDEKLALVEGWPIGNSLSPNTTRPIGVGYLPGVPRLGVPSLTFSDGPAGVRIQSATTTALPAPVALASTFSAELAHDYGTVLGHDARSSDQDVVFGPMLNLVRAPEAGRNFETLGEDPELLGTLGAAEIQGIQSTGTIATAKHFAEYNQETDRESLDVSVDERTEHELELRGFETAVKQGQPGAVMCSYNKVNGTFTCENPQLLTQILRNQWGFKGFVVSDYGSNHSSGAALESGMDVEFAGIQFLTLKPQILAGLVPMSALNNAVSSILTTMQRFGLLSGSQRTVPAYDAAGGAATALSVAEQGSVLLRNSAPSGSTQPLLPLSGSGAGSDAGSVAVIGPTGRQLLVGGGGSSRVVGNTADEITPLDALHQDGVATNYAVGQDLQGTPVPSSALHPPHSTANGLLRQNGTVDPQLNFTGTKALPEGTGIGWTGTLVAPETGDYLLALQTSGVFGALVVDGRIVNNTTLPQLADPLQVTTDGLSNASGTVHLTAGTHEITIVNTPYSGIPPVINGSSGPVQVRLSWVTPSQQKANVAAAVAAAKQARTAVVFAYQEGREMYDQTSLSLPNGQDALIEAVAAANPRTVVVLNSGYPVVMPWLNQVGAVLDTWYPGQEGGTATADLLLGKANPGGKLPVTFPASDQETPVSASDQQFPGVNDEESYSEGVFVGYRWYDQNGIIPEFPFGFGLSYTTFTLSDLSVSEGASGPVAQVTVTNTGSRAGAEVAQVYAGKLPAPVATPPRQLAGATRVTLAPGAGQRVTVPLDVHSLSYWDTGTHAWVRPSGPVTISAGDSSRNLPLSTTLTSP